MVPALAVIKKKNAGTEAKKKQFAMIKAKRRRTMVRVWGHTI